MSLMNDKLKQSISLGIADVVRQGLSKDSINPRKSVAVAASDYVAAYTVMPIVESAVTSFMPDLSDDLKRITVDVVSATLILLALDELDWISPSDASPTGKKGSRVMKAFSLASMDVLMQYIINIAIGTISTYEAPAPSSGGASTTTSPPRTTSTYIEPTTSGTTSGTVSSGTTTTTTEVVPTKYVVEGTTSTTTTTIEPKAPLETSSLKQEILQADSSGWTGYTLEKGASLLGNAYKTGQITRTEYDYYMTRLKLAKATKYTK